MSNLATVIGLYMRVNNISYRAMAKRIGIPTSDLNRFVNGHMEPSAQNLTRMLNWLMQEEL